MASLLLFRRPLAIGLGLTTFGATYSLLQQPSRQSRLLYCDSHATPLSSSLHSYSTEAQVPVVKKGRPNPAAYKQISSGSILGLVGGLAVSTFSRTLAFLFGLLVFGVQFAASRGYNIIPTTRLQRYVKRINLRSAVMDNVAFKLSFGTTFMLAAFADF